VHDKTARRFRSGVLPPPLFTPPAQTAACLVLRQIPELGGRPPRRRGVLADGTEQPRSAMERVHRHGRSFRVGSSTASVGRASWEYEAGV
jgi:hypothetical protein